MMSFLALLSALTAALGSSQGTDLQPIGLTCEGHAAPLGAPARPRLSWQAQSKRRGERVTAWQVQVARGPVRLAAGEADLWDSGRVAATQSPHVIYAGEDLRSGEVCHWRVRLWDAAGEPTPWSDSASWEVAPLAEPDWGGARWIDDGRALPEDDRAFYRPDPAPRFIRDFAVSKPITQARLHVAGLGLFRVQVNGQPVAEREFGPPWTAFHKRVLFSTYDVTEQLTKGGNRLGIEVGNGWFQPLPLRMWGRLNLREHLPVGRPRAIACLVITHGDGSVQRVVTGPDWLTAPGATVRNNLYLGEVRDGRLDDADWSQAGARREGWATVRALDVALGPLEARLMEPVVYGESFAARSVSTSANGTHIVDFGINFTGVPEITVTAPRGTEVTLRYGELLNEDGSLNPLTSVCGQIKGRDGKGGAPAVAWQEDVYITRGGGAETYRPRFTYHGFRYMEVSGLTGPLAVADCVGVPMGSDLVTAGTFRCSSDLLNRIQDLCLNTFRANVVGVQSDCPHRERFAYGGDIVATSEAFLINLDMAAFYAKTVRDWGDSARADGRFTDTAPFVGIDYCGVGWAMVHPLLMEQLHRHYGDRRLLEEQFPGAFRWLRVEAARREVGLVTKGLGDHEALEGARGGAIRTPMFVETARRMGRLARILGREAEARRCDAWAQESQAAWAQAFLVGDGSIIKRGSQSELAIALASGVVPEETREAVVAALVASLDGDDGPRLTTGIFGTRALLEELSRAGRTDLALALAERRTFPSWGWMLENDATTLWEHWEGSRNTFSNNHPMFGSVSGWFHRWLGGIQVAEDAVGFDRVLIRPQTPEGLDHVDCVHQSLRGPCVSRWARVPGGVRYEIEVPVGTVATVELERVRLGTLTEGGKPLQVAPGLERLDAPKEHHRLRLGAGSYEFIALAGAR